MYIFSPQMSHLSDTTIAIVVTIRGGAVPDNIMARLNGLLTDMLAPGTVADMT
jgi:hypothetical protein